VRLSPILRNSYFIPLAVGAAEQNFSTAAVRKGLNPFCLGSGPAGRELGALSTQLNTASLLPSWKQEINQRLAEHRSRQFSSADAEQAAEENHPVAGKRRSQAAARVAARYAHAPSYNELLTGEVRAAEAASKAAIEAHAAMQSMLASLEAAPAPVEEPAWEPAPAPSCEWAAKARSGIEDNPYFPFDEPIGPTAAPAPAQEPEPAYANLIEFPRPMVATRKVRPRLAEGPLATAPTGQLSIFEVDQAAISTEPASSTMDKPEAPEWMRQEWPDFAPETQAGQERIEEPAPQALPSNAAVMAPASLRMLSASLDAVLIAAAFLATVAMALPHLSQFPGPKAVGAAAGLGLLAFCTGYQMLFMALLGSTPGMKYAGLELNTLDGFRPTRKQRFVRLLALPLSVLPLGLGLVWAILDEGHLSWHDRLSRTCLCKH
jgi:hypothetical protein